MNLLPILLLLGGAALLDEGLGSEARIEGPRASPAAQEPVEQSAVPTAEQTIAAFNDLVKDNKKTVEVQVAIEGLVRLYESSLADAEGIQLKIDRKQGSVAEMKKELRDGERLRRQLAYEVWKVFRFRRRDHAANQGIWKKALWAFGRMPEHGSDYLWRAFEDKRYRKNSKARCECIKQIGLTKDYQQHAELLDLLQHHDYAVIAAAATAVGNFAGAPGKVRWECTKELVKKLESYANAANSGGDSGAGRRYGRSRGPMMRSLETLTGQTYDNSLGWTRFWNKNKRNKKLWKN